MSVRQFNADAFRHEISVKCKFSLGGFSRIRLSQGSGCGIARICVKLCLYAVSFSEELVCRLEVLVKHENLTAHFKI